MNNNLCTSYFFSLQLFLLSFNLSAQTLFDTHLHYTAEDAENFPPQTIVEFLDKNNIYYAAVIGEPSEHMDTLYRLAPDRIVPLLGRHTRTADKTSWVNDENFISYLTKEIERDYWQGLGELHIFADDRHSNVFGQVVTLASKNKLPLLIHADPAVIDTLYEIAPDQMVIWAHAGTFPYPDLVSDYLRRYPNLMIDVSVRDDRISKDGVIDDDWYELFVTYPDRIMVGVDTYSTSRWSAFDTTVGVIRNWLTLLPDEIAAQLVFHNAAKLYNKPHIID